MPSKFEAMEKEAKRIAEITSRQGSQFWKPKLGANLIRILPHWSGDPEKVFFKKVKKHFGLGDPKTQIICRKTLGADTKCPICDHVHALRSSSRSEDRDLVKELSAKERFAMNIVDVNDLAAGVQIWELGIILFNTLIVLFMDKDYGEMDSLKTGRHLKVNRVGETRYDTRYTIVPAANPSAVDPAVMERVINLDELENYQVQSEASLSALIDGDSALPEDEDLKSDADEEDDKVPFDDSPSQSLTLPGAGTTRASRVASMKAELEKK